MGDSLGESRSREPPDRHAELDLRGVVEPALAEALMLAARAGRWELVEQIAGELAERRRAPENDEPDHRRRDLCRSG